MPPEPLPWDRKDFFKERKHERSEFLGPVPRWRDSSSHGSREFSRWGSGDFRRQPGQGRQGGWHVFSDEYGHGYGPSVSHGDGKYARNGRESRSFSQRDWKGHSWATNNGFANNGGRLQHDLNYDQRSVHDMLINPSHSHSDFVNPRDKVKGQHDKIDDVNGLGTSQRRDYSVSSSGWKPLKWTRSGGLSSRTSTPGHSSSTKSIDALDSNETKSETVLKNELQNLSPSADPAECAMYSLQCDEANVRKKPRLGWGEGLAKYEKKKVEVPEGTAFTVVNAECTHSLNSSLLEKGPRGAGFTSYASPATPSSVICGSSPGGDEKSSGKASSDNDVGNLGSPGFLNQYDGTSSNLEKLNDFSVANLGSPLIQLLQPNDSTSVDSSFTSSTALIKLLIYKKEISKVLETTESEIDSLENELKGLRSVSKGHFSFPLASSSLLVWDKYVEGLNDVSDMIPPSAPPPVVTSADIISKTVAHCTRVSEEVHPDVKENDWCGRLDVKESIIMKEKLTISGSSGEYNVVNNLCIKSEDATLEPISSDMNEYADARGDNVFDYILASNKESAYKASEALMRMYPANDWKIDIYSTNACSQNHCLLKERFADKKRLSRFKERVIALKYKAYQSMWKESLHVPPVRKLRTKSQKKHQSSLWTNYGGYQKNRSSIGFRMPSPGNVNHVVSNTEILKHVSKQLSNPQTKQYRKTLKMPALIVESKDKMASRFVSNNGLVEDPLAVEKERMMINPWTSEEKGVFMEKLECFGKDFGKIASFLDHKTTADCIEFYYKNHKSDCFEKTKKLEFGKKAKSSTSNYLMTTGKKWNPETNAAASLDMFGAASATAIRADNKYPSSSRLVGGIAYQTNLFEDNLSERAKSFHIFGNEREKVAANVLAGICGSLSSEAMGSSCVTCNLDLKGKKGATTILRRCTLASIQQYADDEVCSDESCGEMDLSYWTDGEKSLFIEAVTFYGKNFPLISTHVGSKSMDQCKVFFSKGRKCLGLDLICCAKKMPAKDAFPCKEDDLTPKFATTINVDSSHQDDKVSNPSSKTCHSNAAVDAMVSDDACNRKDGSHSALDEDCQSANDKNCSDKQHQIVPNLTAKDRRSSAPITASDTKIKMENIHTFTDRDEKANSHTADSSSTPSAKDEQGHCHVRAHSRSYSDSERSSRNSDIKLFGQILTHSSSVPSLNSRSSENGNRNQHKFKRRLKVNSHGNLSTAKFVHKSSPEQSEDAPSRSYGVWDGTRIHTGLPSLPDPTNLLSRYPTFDGFSKSASQKEQLQQPICNVQKSKGYTQMSEVNSSKVEEVVGGIIVGEICNDDEASDTKLKCNGGS